MGAVVTDYVTRTQERRRRRADAHHWATRLMLISGGVRGVEIGPAPYPSPGGRLATGLGLVPILQDGTDAEQALREALAGLLTAVLAAGMPRRVTDFAGGAHERMLADRRARPVRRWRAGAGRGPARRAAHEYRRAATGLLLSVLWRPWRARLRLRGRLARLRLRVHELNEQQQAAKDVLVEHKTVLYQRIDPDGTRRAAWGPGKSDAGEGVERAASGDGTR